ncbi:MAG: NnrS family protein [Beijerinckiaceae bacterium]
MWGGGFRPLFLAAALWAVIAIAIWDLCFSGEISVPTAFSPVDWHIHEMIYGYGSAVVAGFLLTAIPNWTGRLPVAGRPLALICMLWALGRCAVYTSAIIGPATAAAGDALFLIVFAGIVGREVIAARSVRNLKVIILVLVLAIANAGFHIEAATTGTAPISARLGLATLVFLILLIGGRIVPSFTHNWLAKRGTAARPVSFGRPDGLIMILSGVALILWVAFPGLPAVGAVLVAAGAANLWRLSRWQGWNTRSDRLLLILHAGFFFAGLGFVVTGAASLLPDLVPTAAGVHVWAIGAIGTMTLAMMTRTTLGHTGRELRASVGTQVIYFAIIVAMGARIAMALTPAFAPAFMHAAAFAWIIAFLGFVALYGPMLMRPRAGAK